MKYKLISFSLAIDTIYTGHYLHVCPIQSTSSHIHEVTEVINIPHNLSILCCVFMCCLNGIVFHIRGFKINKILFQNKHFFVLFIAFFNTASMREFGDFCTYW